MMDINALHTQLETLGIQLWLEGDELRFKAPQGVFTPELRAQVKSRRDELIAYLQAQDLPQTDTAHAYEPFPLTEVQAAYLIGRTGAYAHGNTACHGYAEFDFVHPEAFTAEECRQAWQKVVQCHPMLKVVVSAEGWQRIDPTLDLPLQINNVAHPEAFARAQQQVRDSLRRKQYAIESAPYFDIVLVNGIGQKSLHLSVDLILTDFLGLQTLLTDFASALQHPEQPLTPPTLSFRDYLAHQHRQQNSATGQQRKAQATAYWQSKLATLPPPMDFGGRGWEDSAQATARYRRRAHIIPAAIWQNLCRRIREAGLTPNALVLAILARVARRYGSEARTTITATLLDRAPFCADVERIVGDFTSTLLIAVDGGEESLLARANSIQTTLFEALEQRALSGMDIARLYERETGNKNTYSDVVVTSTIGAGKHIDNNPLRNVLARGLSQTPQVLLDVQLSDHEQGLAIVWDSRDGGFCESVLDAAFADFTQAFTHLHDTPELWQGDVLKHRPLVAPPLPAAPEQTLIQDWLSHVAAHPDHIALRHGQHHLTHGDLYSKACQYRDYLYAQQWQAGDSVFIQLPQGFAQIAAQLGTLLAGGIFVPVSAHAPAERLEAMRAILQESRPDHRCHLLDETTPLEVAPTTAEHYPIQATDIAYIIFTSGTTGKPKGVPITHRQAMNTLQAMRTLLSLSAADRVFALSQPTFDLAIFNVFALLNVGGSIVIPTDETGLNAQAWLNDLHTHAVSIWNAVPAQLQLLLEACEREQTACPSTLRAALLSGDWIPVHQPHTLQQYAPQCRFIALGGATEAAIWSNYHLPNATDDTRAQRSIPYGRPLAGQDMRILNADLEEAVIGQVGDIVISGESVSNGYLGADNHAFFTHPDTHLHSFLTGDRGRYLANGEIEFLGRKDTQIKLRGYRIELGEVEAALKSLPDVEDAVAFVDKQQLHAVIKARPSRAPLAAAIAAQLSATHQNFLNHLDLPTFLALYEQSNQAALCAMQAILQADIQPAPRNVALLKRWQRLLTQNPCTASEISLEHAQALLQAARPLGQKIQYGDQQLDYVEQCIVGLAALVRGELDPLSLLFPEGKMDVAQASYADNLINRHLNTLLKDGITQYATHAAQTGKPLRILEIGGGVGATTQAIIPALEALKAQLGLEYEYTFTDISDYFLSSAKSRWPQLHCRQFNLNHSFNEEGFTAGSFDIVLCANVLHNARNIPMALQRIHTLLAPDGALAAIDASRPNASLMITMEFKEGLTDFTDERAQREEVFYDYAGWQRALAESDFVDTYLFPDEDNTVYDATAQTVNQAFYQVVIWAQKGHFAAALQPEALTQQLLPKLPEYMIPTTLTTLPRLPLTTNGKIDRRRILELIQQTAQTTKTTATATTHSQGESTALNEQQQQVAAVWREVLNMDADAPISPQDNFFAIGGDSLLLARCIGCLRKAIPGGEALVWDTLLRDIVANPTLEHCTHCFFPTESSAECVESDTQGHSPLIPLLPATSSKYDADCAVVLVHDGSGGIGPYRDVIDAFAQLPEHPACLGLIRTKDDGYLTLPADVLFGRLAERYVDALVAAGYRKVYLLGYCMGGLIAATMAEQLLARGIEVANLSVISAYRIPFDVQDDVLLDYAFARLLGEQPALMGLGFDETELGALITKARQQYHETLSSGALQQLSSEFPHIAAVLAEMPQTTAARLEQLTRSSQTLVLKLDELHALRDIYIASMRAVAAFNYSGYFGDITFFRQRGDIPFLPQLKEDMTQFWQQYCLGQLNIHDINGNHFTCLSGENGRHIATELARSWQ